MSKLCPILNEKVVYLECLECEDKECQHPKEPESQVKDESKDPDYVDPTLIFPM